MAGAPSHLELFDHKPELAKWDGKLPPAELLKGYRAAFIDPNSTLLGPKFKFARHGQSGAELSELLPHLAGVADDIAIVKSMHTDAFNHAPAQIFMNTGSTQFGRPSFGAWTTYGLGCESNDLPAYVVFSTGQPISREDRTRLSFARNRPERNAVPPAALGQSANAGSRVWDRQYRFRLHLGPLTHAQTLAFLPGGEAWPRLQHWVRLLAGREMQWELQLDIAAAEQPAPRLGRTPGQSPRLGLTTRLGRPAATQPFLAPRALRLRPHTSFLAQLAERAARAATRATTSAHSAGVPHDA